MWINVYPSWKMNFGYKNGRKWSFSFETKASKSFISTSRMCLSCPILKRKEIIMWIQVYLNWKTNFNSRNSRKRNCSYETKALVSFFPIRRMWLWCPFLKKKEIIICIHVYPNWKTNFDSKHGWKWSFSRETDASKSLITIRRICL